MERLYYTVKEVAVLLGGTEERPAKAYEVIKQLNAEIKELYKDRPANEQPILLAGRVNKEYFNKRIKLEV